MGKIKAAFVLVLALALLGRLGHAGLRSSFQRGICVEGGPQLQECNIAELRSYGATSVSLNPFGWMAAPDVPQVNLNPDRQGGPGSAWWGESDEGLRQYAALAHRHGLGVMLRPHLWLEQNTDRAGRKDLWLGDVGFPTAPEWETFFRSYRLLALHYARLAEEARIEWYSVGAELGRASLEHPEQWRSIIADVRKVYRGKLLYSANWAGEVEGITFWDALDAIGVQAYHPVAAGPEDSEERMLEQWKKPLGRLAELSRRYGRPVIFTEIGYKSSARGAVEPWQWSDTGEPRLDVQERAYRAALRAVEATPEIQGMYWWKYHVTPIEESRFRGRRRSFAMDYTWQGKPAEAVLRQFYSAPHR